MTAIFLRACAATVQMWTRVYTAGLAPEVRDTRRQEIACDLWHGMREADRSPAWLPGLQMLLRLALGVPDDLGWRVEHQRNERARIGTRVAVALTLLLLAVAWGLERVSVAPLPPPKERTVVRVSYPPPPPPPAPPASSDGGSEPAIEPAYGCASYAIATRGTVPARIKYVPAVYPPILMAADVEGVVILEGRITDSGRVEDVRAVQPQGFLTQSAIDAVKQWEFEPSARSRDTNILTVTVRFTHTDRVLSGTNQ